MAPSAIDTPEARSEGQPGGLTELRAAGAAREAGIGLCLSGGGYRAMLFHIGALWRLYDAGLLGTVKRISSVSGGSITAGLLGLSWGQLSFRPSAAKRRLRAPGGRADPPSRRPNAGRHRRDRRHPAARDDRRPHRRGLRRAPLRQGDAPGPAGRTALRHQRHERAVWGALALLQAVHGRLPCWAGRESDRAAGDSSGRLVGIPAGALTRDP